MGGRKVRARTCHMSHAPSRYETPLATNRRGVPRGSCPQSLHHARGLLDARAFIRPTRRGAGVTVDHIFTWHVDPGKEVCAIRRVWMPTVQISYFETVRGLLWTEEIDASQLEETRLEAESKGENERVEAIEGALAKLRVPFWLRVDKWKEAAVRVRT